MTARLGPMRSDQPAEHQCTEECDELNDQESQSNRFQLELESVLGVGTRHCNDGPGSRVVDNEGDHEQKKLRERA